MSEEAQPKEKKWTEWSVVSMGDGTLRCRRANLEDEKDNEYSGVDRPVFSREEIEALVAFGSTRLLPVSQLAGLVYDNRYRQNAFRHCAALNGASK